MPDLSMLTSTRTNFHLKTALIYQNVGSPELLDQVTKMFDRVIYYEVDGFHFSPNWPHPTEAELASADVLFAVQLPPNLISIDQMPRLQFFQGLSSGVGHILSSPFWQSIPQDYPLAFSNATGLQVSSIGEHVVASILMLWHRLPTLIIRAHQEEAWVSNAEMGGHYIREMRGAVVGVLGYGAIGREVARLSSAFGTTIIACTRSGTPTTLSPTAYQVPGTGDTTSQLPVAYYSTKSISSFHDFLSRCDVVVNTLPGTPDNYRLIGEAELRVMKGDALLVNVGRGTTVCTESLVDALTATRKKGELPDATGSLRIGGAALDVTDPEPLPRHHPLFRIENCVITPHASGLSRSYLPRAVGLLKENLRRLNDGLEILNDRSV